MFSMAVGTIGEWLELMAVGTIGKWLKVVPFIVRGRTVDSGGGAGSFLK